MQYRMDYQTGKAFMQDKCRNGSKGQFTAYKNIIIHYPGYKRNGDYQLEITGYKVPTHIDICQILYGRIMNGRSTYDEFNKLLYNVYHFGTTISESTAVLVYMQNLIYWVTLQEEINYSRAKGYAGINLAFCRFYESIYCTKSKRFRIEEVYSRCNNHGRQKPELYEIEDAPDYYHY